MLLAHLRKATGDIIHGLSSVTRLIELTRRSYHPITGVFGNYRPYRMTEGHIDTFEVCQSDSNLPNSHRFVKLAFQQSGHRIANLDPLTEQTRLDKIDFKKLSSILNVDLIRFIEDDSSGSKQQRSEFVDLLYRTYCHEIAYEFGHLMNHEERLWLVQYIENKPFNKQFVTSEEKKIIAEDLLENEALDHFLAKKFQSVKRYGCEGAETMSTFVNEIIQSHSKLKTDQKTQIVIGMPHRGRLNLLLNSLQYEPAALFHKISGKAEFNDNSEPGRSFFTGDVISHLYTTTEINEVEVTLLPNPSHLEAVSPVVCGYIRGLLMDREHGPFYSRGNTDYPSLLPLQIHGDAAFAGQGIIPETLALANVEHFTVGGSIHLIVNNQVGYTMPGRMHQARSSLHCSDSMKAISAPVIHVNGARPELVAYSARLAHEYRQTFGKDIAVNLVCYRLHGHNELDDPTFTNPLLYKKIDDLEMSIPQKYATTIFNEKETSLTLNRYNERLNNELQKAVSYVPPQLPKLISQTKWNSIGWPSNDLVTKWATPYPSNVLQAIGKVMTTVPDDLNLHPTLKRVFKDRLGKINSGKTIDWATAELLAFGSMLHQGYNIRISGQDVGRGTFSQRHAMVVDQSNEDVYIPLNSLTQQIVPTSREKFGKFEVCNSILSEEAVMAFEYGLSWSSPNTLPIWEAQFGDFFNGAQTVLDTMISSGEIKWMLPSSLMILLPHGWDGAGPEHTTSRVERFLQMSNSKEAEIDSDNVNWNVVYPSTPAQHFHLLRRQMNRSFRKPTIVLAPKMLLRHPSCVSSLDEMSSEGGHFATLLDDPSINSKNTDSVKTIIFCSGKHYYTLEKERTERAQASSLKAQSIAIVRLEELVPFPVEDIACILSKYKTAKKLLWCQEEHRNMGAWSFVQARFDNILKQKIIYAGRNESAVPAVGIGIKHQQEVKTLMENTFSQCC